MAMNDKSVFTSVRGAAFLADANTALPSLKLFGLEVATVGETTKKYTNMGNLSVSDLPSFETSGGDATTKDTWNKSKFRTTYDSVTGKVTISSVQGDKETFKLMFDAAEITGGGTAVALDKVEQPKALFIYVEDTNTGEKFGIWIPNMSLAYSELPSLAQDDFNTFKLEGNIMTSTVLPKTKSGKASSIAFYDPDDFAKRVSLRFLILPLTGVLLLSVAHQGIFFCIADGCCLFHRLEFGMAENDVEENVFPTDWDGLAGYDDVMAGLPEMVQAESFSPSQTALFAVVERRLNERLLVMRDGGVFGGKAKKTVSMMRLPLPLPNTWRSLTRSIRGLPSMLTLTRSGRRGVACLTC